jgi:hypothetical protein
LATEYSDDASRQRKDSLLGATSLEAVGLEPGSLVASDGLVSVRHPPSSLPVNEAALTRQLGRFELVDYVFFRRFNDGRSSQPAALVIDNTDEAHTEQDVALAHHQLWLAGIAPIVYVAKPTRIDILSCARQPDFWKNGQCSYSPADTLEIASQVDSELAKRHRYAAGRLADGSFWEDRQNQSLADHQKAAHESLIRSVVEADRALNGEGNPLARRLLLLTILVKYLEDRGVFPNAGWFGRFRKGARSFLDVLSVGEPDEVAGLLKFLEDRFNGDVFSIPDGYRLTKKVLRSVAELVEARTVNGQRYLWELYSFDFIPIEVISHLYNRFVKGNTAVYTPPFMADLLLDYAMPCRHLSGHERVLDPACGSGVFLVGAFKRLVNAWRSRHRWRTPDVDTLKELLRSQIFGVEQHSSAVDLTAFSLSLAVCDALQPNVIWEKLRFDKLRGASLRQADFFDICLKTDRGDGDFPSSFDVIVGNPPFESNFTEAADAVCKARGREEPLIPDKQIAYLFLDRCLPKLSKQGRLCLIQSSNFLYNLKSHPFRSAVALSGRLEKLLDFTSIRGLFKPRDPKTVAVLAGPASCDSIDHFTFRRTFRVAEVLGFEIDHYDRHQLTPTEIADDPRAARTNLLGGGRLGTLAARIRQKRTLGKYVKNRGWLMGEGYIAGTGGTPAAWLTGKRLLPTEALTRDEIAEEELAIVSETSFIRPRNEELYKPPLILIKENESLPIAYWDDGSLAFKHEIVGIRPCPGDEADHKALHADLFEHADVLRFCLLINGSRALVAKATAVHKNDIEQLPYPDNLAELSLANWEQIIADDTLKYMADFVRLGQNSILLKAPASDTDMATYASTFGGMLGTLYENLNAAEPVFLNGLICQPFYFGDTPNVEWLGIDCEEQLIDLIYDESLPSLRTVRVVRLYHENVLFVIKPDRLRYWIPSVAIRDADDTLTDLQQQGY